MKLQVQMIKVAIHHRPGSFSDGWINYCKKNNIPYEIVNAFSNNIIEKLKKYDLFLWHYHHNIYEDTIAARKILNAIEQAGIKVFPNFKTAWHFDDKIAETYLLQALGAPVTKSYIFYERNEAEEWARNTSYPKIFKLKNGASGSNVHKISDKEEAIKFIKKSFTSGHNQFNGFHNLKETIRKYKRKEASLFNIVKALARVFIKTKFSRWSPKERGYAYFQDYIENNGFDTRVIVIGDKAFTMKNIVRQNDFRASNSGDFIFDKNEININAVELAFETQKKIGSQSTGFDIIESVNGDLFILEMGYGFIANIYRNCPGYWSRDLNWHAEKFIPEDLIIEEIIKTSIG